jgi:pimeloyl-ACP methyl ester carboxylesterase
MRLITRVSFHFVRIFRSSLIAFVCILAILSSSVAQNPASRPILFAHGYCGSAFDFEPLLAPLYQQLPASLYPSSTIYYVFYDSIENAVTFSTLVNGVLVPTDPPDGSSIPPSTRFFSILFYDPVKKSVDPSHVAKISVLNKAYELSQVIKHITSITHVKDVIVVGHSMGGLDARTYVENLASPGACYDYTKNQPDYSQSSCTPGSGNAAFAGDVGDIVTVDTPHAGTPIAELDTQLLEPFLACIPYPSTNRSELNLKALGGAGLVEALNYDGSPIAGVSPSANPASIEAVEDYFSDVTNPWDNFNNFLTGYSDDVVLLPSQSVKANLPPSDTDEPLQDIPVSYLSSDSGIAETPACWVDVPILGPEPLLHFMTCLGAQPDTQNAIATQINANVNGTLTNITVNAIYNGNPWSGAVSYQLSGPNGTQSETSVPATVTDIPLGTYSVSYLSGGPTSSSPASIVATPSPTLQSGQWSVTFTMQFSSQNSAVATLPATSITSSSATLNGTVNPNFSTGQVNFYWGTDPTMTTFNNYGAGNVIANGKSQSFAAPLTGLATTTTYYFQTVFFNTSNNSFQYGAILSFTTQ